MAVSTFKIRDYAGDLKQFSFNSEDVTVAANYAAAVTLHNNFSAALSDVILGNKAMDAYTPRTVEVTASPASPVAQTNVQWLVTLRDSVDGHRETLSIPTADIATATLRLPGTDIADLAAAEWVAFVDALEALIESSEGNAMTVESIVYKQ